jgi:hypothetical protein
MSFFLTLSREEMWSVLIGAGVVFYVGAALLTLAIAVWSLRVAWQGAQRLRSRDAGERWRGGVVLAAMLGVWLLVAGQVVQQRWAAQRAAAAQQARRAGLLQAGAADRRIRQRADEQRATRYFAQLSADTLDSAGSAQRATEVERQWSVGRTARDSAAHAREVAAPW